MESEFLKKLFNNETLGAKYDDFEIINLKLLDIARLYCVYKSIEEKSNVVLLPQNFIHPMLRPISIGKSSVNSLTKIKTVLAEAGFEKVDQVYDLKQYSLKGDVLTIYTSINNLVYRIEFFGENLEKISLLDNISLRPKQDVENFIILNIFPDELDFHPEIFGKYDSTNPNLVIYSNKTPNETEQNTLFKTKDLPLFHKNEKVFQQYLEKYSDYECYYLGHNWELLPEGFKANLSTKTKELKRIHLEFALEKGFLFESKKIIVLTDREILSTLNLAKSKSKISSKFKKFFDSEVNIGDFVVHEAHGVGVYTGIETKVVLGEVKDYAVVEYLEKDKLLVPLDQLNRISKYISADGGQPKLTRLGTAEWEVIKRKLKKSVEDIAGELLQIYAKKNMEKGIKFEVDNSEQIQFEKSFKYKLTEDQFKTINEVKDDMESIKPMDRLVIGDVGFGKTEIALRSAFKAIQSGKQVLVLAPTTVLVTQLYNVFASRFSKFKIKVARISRFDGTQKNKQNIQKANEGHLDVLIGTHRLLSKDVNLPNLGLLIIDEEQRFGVKQKEKIRQLRANIDLLSLSATPIPRTLQMALTGIKDISIIATPPEGRLPVHNEVIFKEEIAEKIAFEVKRKGQVFVVHNKIQGMPNFVEGLKSQLPESVKIGYGHAQMSPEKLEKIMFEFQEGVYDVLIATTIIENGLDIPSVNTIIIDDAHTFGLSQLYQLRGRVGRSDIQSYCYLVVPKTKEFIDLHKNPNAELRNLRKLLEDNKIEDSWITPDAVSRIEAILDNQELGVGFKIASRDLEIRGSGNILGSQQSGHINAVGYEMFIRLLEQEIDRIRKVNV